MEFFEIGTIVQLRMPVRGRPAGAVGQIVEGRNDEWQVLFAGDKEAVTVLGMCLRRLSVSSASVHQGQVYTLLVATVGYPAGTPVMVLSQYEDQATVQLPSKNSTIIPKTHLGKSSIAAKIRHLFTR